jgi:hypothetical protein
VGAPGFGVTVWVDASAWANAGWAPSAASPINMARTVPRIVFNTRIVPQFETFGWQKHPAARPDVPGARLNTGSVGNASC